MESARSMLSHAHLSNRFWAEAVATAAYLRNRSATTALDDRMTPYEKWHGRKPNLEHLRVFGCVAYAHVPDCNRRKLDDKAEKLRFVCYSKNPTGYRLYDECTNKVMTRRDVVFDESNFLQSSEPKQGGESLKVLFPTESPEIVEEEAELQEVESRENTVPEPQVRRSDRAHSSPNRCGDWVTYTATCGHFAYNTCQVPEPKTMDEALAGPHAKEWKEAAESEYRSLMENNTWDLVELPEGREAIGS